MVSLRRLLDEVADFIPIVSHYHEKSRIQNWGEKLCSYAPDFCDYVKEKASLGYHVKYVAKCDLVSLSFLFAIVGYVSNIPALYAVPVAIHCIVEKATINQTKNWFRGTLKANFGVNV